MGRATTIVGGFGLSAIARARRSVAASGMADCGLRRHVHAPPGVRSRAPLGREGQPVRPGIRPAACVRDRSTHRAARARSCATARPLAQFVTPVPVGAIVSARTSRLGSSSSAATAATSLTSRSVSMMIGRLSAAGSFVSELTPHAPPTRQTIARDRACRHVAVIGDMVGSVATGFCVP